MAEVKTPRKALEVGDVVALNSGGSPMTVTGIVPKLGAALEYIACSWEGKDGLIHNADFPEAALKVTTELNPASKPAVPPK